MEAGVHKKGELMLFYAKTGKGRAATVMTVREIIGPNRPSDV